MVGLARIGILFLFISFLISVGAHAAGELTLKARSIPDTCEFVYRVESDFSWDVSTLDLTRFKSITLSYELEAAYADESPSIRKGALFVSDPSVRSLEHTLVTMSTNPRHLYRDAYFSVVVEHTDGTQNRYPASTGTSTDMFYYLDLSTVRDRCFADGRVATPYRDVTLMVKAKVL